MRRPLKLGAAGAWREALIHDALTYRPLSGGRVLVVERGSAVAHETDRITLTLDDGTRARELLAGVVLQRDPTELEVEDGRVYLTLGYSRQLLSRKKTLDHLPR